MISTIIWFQVFQCNMNNFQIDLTQNGPGNNIHKGVFYTPQSSIARISKPDVV